MSHAPLIVSATLGLGMGTWWSVVKTAEAPGRLDNREAHIVVPERGPGKLGDNRRPEIAQMFGR